MIFAQSLVSPLPLLPCGHRLGWVVYISVGVNIKVIDQYIRYGQVTRFETA